jgi:hypothetical protein
MARADRERRYQPNPGGAAAFPNDQLLCGPVSRLTRQANRAAGAAHGRTTRLGDAPALLQIGEQERARAAHPPRVTVHDVEAGADQRRQIDLIRDQRQPRVAAASGTLSAALSRSHQLADHPAPTYPGLGLDRARRILAYARQHAPRPACSP